MLQMLDMQCPNQIPNIWNEILSIVCKSLIQNQELILTGQIINHGFGTVCDSDPRESWMKFKDDVESALQKKPNQAGFYKNLADMMHNKMEMLDQVGKSSFLQCFPTFLNLGTSSNNKSCGPPKES